MTSLPGKSQHVQASPGRWWERDTFSPPGQTPPSPAACVSSRCPHPQVTDATQVPPWSLEITLCPDSWLQIAKGTQEGEAGSLSPPMGLVLLPATSAQQQLRGSSSRPEPRDLGEEAAGARLHQNLIQPSWVMRATLRDTQRGSTDTRSSHTSLGKAGRAGGAGGTVTGSG